MVLFCLAGFSVAHAAPPSTITYQGFLTSSSGSPINASVTMTLSLYADATGGTALWTETQNNVAVVNGVYSVLMGSVTPININTLPFDTTYYLGVKVGNNAEMTPRQVFASVPYSFRAMGADKLNQTCADGQVLMYSTTSSSWSCSTAVGPQGSTGPQGTAGTNGSNGNTLLSGNTDPSAGTGANGDFYLNTASNKIFGPKAAGTWPAGVSLVGPQGSSGANYTVPKAPVLATGQQKSYAVGDDGDWMIGAASPSTRFFDNGDGTVKDNLTGLIWLKNANCFGPQTWAAALTSANSLASPSCSLSDGSTAGQWRLPNRKELMSLVDRSQYNPALPTGNPFSSTVQSDSYWSGSTSSGNATNAWGVFMVNGYVGNGNKAYSGYVWPVRAGQ